MTNNTSTESLAKAVDGTDDQMADSLQSSARQAAGLLFRLENVPFGWWHTKARIVMGSATFFDAFDALSLAFVMPVLVGIWHLSPGQIGILIAGGYVGQVIGALFFGWLAERWGRVRSVSVTVALMSVMSIACAFSGNFQTLLLLRFVQGIGVGGEVPVAATYINELSPAHGRGKFFILYELIFPLGLLAAAQVGSFLVPHFGWEYMFLAGGIPGLVILTLIYRLPESPRWLIEKGQFQAAEFVIAKIESSSPNRELDVVSEAVEVEARVSKLMDSLNAQCNGTWRELFSPLYRGRTFVVWALWAASYFVANGINNWLPTLYKTVYQLPLQEALRMASWSNVMSTCAVLVCALLVERVGRRKWAVGCFLVSGTLLAVLAITGAKTALSIAVFGSAAYAVMGSTTVLLYLYTPEIYPTRMRAIGTGLATSWLRMASAAAPAMVGAVLSGAGIVMVFSIFAAVNILGLIAAVRMIETTNRSLEEISP